jgi:hypothetical protein
MRARYGFLEMTTVLVGGALANKFLNGGAAWTRLSWILGLQRLGFSVYFVEQIAQQSCVDAADAPSGFDNCVNLAYFKEVMDRFGLAGRAALICDEGRQVHGLTRTELEELSGEAEMLLNISGHLTLDWLVRGIRRKVFLDLDPGFTQFWHAQGYTSINLEGHHLYFTIGENIGDGKCPIPTSGVPWRPARQPVVLQEWPACHTSACDRFTTVASWRGPYGAVEFHGKTFGLKAHEFRKFKELPRQSPQSFEIALDIHPGDTTDLESLRRHGWRIVDPRVASPDPDTFRAYVQGSDAEFSVAQGIYVDTQSGWFSDRTVRYLASSKPALVQDTGFSHRYPVGEGLVAFRTLEQAVAGAEQITRDYDRHCRAARSLAEAFFDSDKVLGRLVEEIGIAP